MPRLAAAVLSILLAVILHVDWHVARPAHHRLSLGWADHWVITAGLFALAGCLIARRWSRAAWKMGAIVLAAAVLLAQGLEPVLEVLFFEGRLGYPDDPGRLAVFGRTMTAAVPAFWAGLWLCRPDRGPEADPPAPTPPSR